MSKPQRLLPFLALVALVAWPLASLRAEEPGAAVAEAVQVTGRLEAWAADRPHALGDAA
ncbi:MAG: hypothetical protein H6806_07470 [Planctomycetes bacterium]|nr:hypothetical protein [Planctomycetota bacterium]